MSAVGQGSGTGNGNAHGAVAVAVNSNPGGFSLSGTPSPVQDGQAFSFTPSRSGGVGPFTYNISSGTLPAWASLNTSTGAITGTSSGAAVTNVTLHAQDSTPGTPKHAYLPLSITVLAATTGEFDPYYDPSFALISNATYYSVPAVTKPASKASAYSAASYTDSRFNTRIYRATDVADGVGGGNFMRHEYSRKIAFNSDGSKFVARGASGWWWLYDARTFARLDGGRTSAPIGAIGSGASNQFAADCEATWHPTNPNKLWRTDTNGSLTWYELDISTKATTTLFSLSGKLAAFGLGAATRAFWSAEGRPSNDGRWWAFTLQDNAFNQIGFCMYDRQTDTVVGGIACTDNPNNVSTSPLGNYAVISWSNSRDLTMAQAAVAGINATNGTRCYSRDFSTFTQMSYYGEHADTGLDAQGNEVYISVNYNAGKMPDVTDGQVYYRRMDNGVAYNTPVNVYSTVGHSVHMSGCASEGKPGWALVGLFGGAGHAYDGEMLAVELVTSGARVLRLGHHHTADNDYWAEPHGTVNKDFTKVLFASDWGNTTGFESYMIGLPSWAIPAAGVAIPVNTVLPGITGTPAPSATLTAVQGTWTGSPTSYAYQWTKDGVDISGATSTTFSVPGSGYGGAVVRVRETATNGLGNASATSTGVTIAALAAPVNTVAPVVSGGTASGSLLTTTNGTWTGNPSPTFGYQWYADAGAISGATAATNTTVVGDVGKSITCRVTGTNSQGSATGTSNGITVTAGGAGTKATFNPSKAPTGSTLSNGDMTYTRTAAAADVHYQLSYYRTSGTYWDEFLWGAGSSVPYNAVGFANASATPTGQYLGASGSTTVGINEQSTRGSYTRDFNAAQASVGTGAKQINNGSRVGVLTKVATGKFFVYIHDGSSGAWLGDDPNVTPSGGFAIGVSGAVALACAGYANGHTITYQTAAQHTLYSLVSTLGATQQWDDA